MPLCLGRVTRLPPRFNICGRSARDLVGNVYGVRGDRRRATWESKVLAISCVTNMAAGIVDQPLSHQKCW